MEDARLDARLDDCLDARLDDCMAAALAALAEVADLRRHLFPAASWRGSASPGSCRRADTTRSSTTRPSLHGSSRPCSGA